MQVWYNASHNYLHILEAANDACETYLTDPYARDILFSSNGVWNLATYYMGKDSLGYHKYDALALLHGTDMSLVKQKAQERSQSQIPIVPETLPELYFLFDDAGNLKFVQIITPSKLQIDLYVIAMHPKNYNEANFNDSVAKCPVDHILTLQDFSVTKATTRNAAYLISKLKTG
jgi:hypothetical protein